MSKAPVQLLVLAALIGCDDGTAAPAEGDAATRADATAAADGAAARDAAAREPEAAPPEPDAAPPESDAAEDPDAAPPEPDAAPPESDAAKDPDATPAPDAALPPASRLDALDALLAAGDAAALGAFVADYDGPFCEAGDCRIVTHVDGARTVLLRGEMNDWSTNTPMTALPFAPGWFTARLDGLWPEGCLQYKLFADEAWQLDPLNRYIAFADIAINNTLCPPGASRLAWLLDVPSAELDNTRDVFVYLPGAAFDAPGRRFPVLYMQDGLNVFTNPVAPFGSWDVDATADALIAEGAVEPLIIVGITTNDRFNEYLYTPLELDLGGEIVLVDPKLDAYGRFVIGELKPLIDATFPTRPGRADTGIAGSSLGGISALYLAWQRADVFGRVGSFSGSFWIGEDADTAQHPSMRTLLSAAPLTDDQRALRIYLDSGGGDRYEDDARVYTEWTRNRLISLGFPGRPEWDDDGDPDTPPADRPPETDPDAVAALYWSAGPPEGYADWRDYLRPDRSLLHLVGRGQVHNEAAWRARFPAALRFLFPAE